MLNWHMSGDVSCQECPAEIEGRRFLCNDSDFAQWMSVTMMSLTHPVFDLKMVKDFSLYQILRLL